MLYTFDPDINQMLNDIKTILIDTFHKTDQDATNMIFVTDVFNQLYREPLKLLDTPISWALYVLSSMGEVNLIEHYIKQRGEEYDRRWKAFKSTPLDDLE